MILAGFVLPRHWLIAAAAAFSLHLGVILAALLGIMGEIRVELPDPVVLVELPPIAEIQPEVLPRTAAAAPPPQAQADQPVEQTPPPSPLIAAPKVSRPLPKQRIEVAERPASLVVKPEPAHEPTPAPAVPAAPSPAPRSAVAYSEAAPSAGGDRRAKDQESAWYGLISAHLNRKKKYPVEARKAGQKGIVMVRFTIDRDGNVSATSVKRSSGHQLLDQTTLDLMQRVSPLPKMPASMTVERVTLTLPIDYSLTSN